MKNYCAVILIFLNCFSCGVDKGDHEIIDFFDTALEINAKVYDSIGFFQKPNQLDIVSDSLLIAFSNLSGLSIYHLHTGNQLDFIDFKQGQVRNYFFSAFDAKNYPLIYFLEPRKKAVVIYNAEEKQVIRLVNLELDKENSIRVIGGKFKVYNNEYFVELEPSGIPMIDVNYYKKSDRFLGVFGENGSQKRKILEYPKAMKDPAFFFIPANYYSFDIFNEQLFICFPFEKHIKVFDLNSDFKDYRTIKLPELESVDLSMQKIPTKFHPKDYPIEQRLIGPIADKLLISENGQIYLSLVINDNINSDRFREYVTVWRYDTFQGIWSVLKEPVDYFDLGNFAGVDGDLLYFFDAAVVSKDEKYINAIRMK